MTKSAAIIGGGIGGLATAIALGRGGWRVSVHERSQALPETGTALGLWPGALAALDAVGLGEAVRDSACPQVGGAFLRPDGSRIATIDVTAMRRQSGDTVHLLSRPALLRLLAGALEDGVIEWGSQVEDVAQLEGHDVVVGADGLHSGTRRQLFGDQHRVRYVGATAWRGTVPGHTDTVTETWGAGLRFGITPQESGRTNWFAVARTIEGARATDDEVSELRRLFADWHDEVQRVLDALTEHEVLRHDLYDLAPALPSYVRGNVALIGDAAHAMTPDLGRGACEALVDGVELARSLLEHDRVPDALARYDAVRRRPTQRLARMSRGLNRVASARRLTTLRDLGVRAAMAVSGPPP
ncbi:FAD-dependent monooxygenase [Nocardioides sp.]|uniref:FAD-dependent monooxygenase n=1 Tax=Nocardioides sp. TaxID=35761 RepID=UPI002735CD30|nr:FAD-dependent monooxygenase [Nocardioides sp.]MDP3894764.1 FAD-dependent monooxygenase [Nocardioides sp.]